MYYCIVMIKPDGIEANIENEVLCELNKYQINVVEKITIKLTKSDIQNYLYYQFSEFVEYMISGNINLMLLESQSSQICKEVSEIKANIRSKHGKSRNDLKNYIHSAQSGTEYYLQRKLFSSEYFSEKYTDGVDYHARIDTMSKENIEKILYKYTTGNLSKIILCCEENQIMSMIDIVNRNQYAAILALGFSFYRKQYLDNHVFELIYFIDGVDHSKIMHIGLGRIYPPIILPEKALSAVTKDDFISICNENMFATFDKIAKKHRFDSIMVDASVFSLYEAESRGDYAYEKKLSIFGGSCNEDDINKFGVNYFSEGYNILNI